MIIPSDNNQELAEAVEQLKSVAGKVRGGSELPAGERLDEIVSLKSAYYKFLNLRSLVTGILNAGGREVNMPFYTKIPTTKGARQKANNAATKLLKELTKRGVFDENGKLIDANKVTDDERRILGQYSGSGGNLVTSEGNLGSQYEYYTPVEVAAAVWDVFANLGFSGGQVLDPCAGTGMFGATAPETAGITSIELDRNSGMINAAILGRNQSVTVSNFESIAKNSYDETYDAVVANVPFGTKSDRGANAGDDDAYQNESLHGYFVLRSLDKIKAGGMAAFIVPPSVVAGKETEDLRRKVSEKAEFLGAIRLPNKTFKNAAADTIADVVFFRKHTDKQHEKVLAAKLDSEAANLLSSSKVFWDTFLSGSYFKKNSGNIIGTVGVGGRFGNRERVDVDKNTTISSIASSLSAIGGNIEKSGRIDWSLLEHLELKADDASAGDRRYVNGTYQEFDGLQWNNIVSKQAQDKDLQETLAKIQSPLGASEIPAGEALNAIAYAMREDPLSTKPWWIEFNKLAEQYSPDSHDGLWNLACVAFAVEDAVDVPLSEGESYETANPALTERMPAAAAFNKPLKLQDKGGLIGRAVTRLVAFCGVRKAKSKIDGVTSIFNYSWRQVAEGAAQSKEVVGNDNILDSLMYKNKSQWLSVEDVKLALGDDAEISVANGWCYNEHGQVCRAEDYFVGSLSAYYERVDAEIERLEQAGNTKLSNTLKTQKEIALSRCAAPSVKNLTFTLRTPLISPEDKLKFLRMAVAQSSSYTPEKGFETRWSIETKFWNDDGRLASRIGEYINSGKATLGNLKFSEKMPKEKALSALNRLILTKNTEFNLWVHGNKTLMEKLRTTANDPSRLRFERSNSKDPISIDGLTKGRDLHTYQAAYVRAAGREFSGINAFDVGLGKTFTALATVQHVQNIGAKSKTIFVVPSAVLANWHKEAVATYESIDDCFFVGLKEVSKGGSVKMKTDPSLYDAHLSLVAKSAKYRKIFMTAEAFAKINLRVETAKGFADYLGKHHENYDTDVVRVIDIEHAKKQKADVENLLTGKGKDGKLLKKSNAAPSLEDMGIDSIVIDEAHIYKNSVTLKKAEGAKLLSLSPASARGMDAQAKAWYIRSRSPKNDGVILLTATPITNSPLEIFSMMSLAVGHGAVNNACFGIKGGDGFVGTFCEISREDIEGMGGSHRLGNVFTGLNNAEALRDLINATTTIETAESVGNEISLPEAHEVFNDIDLTSDVEHRLSEIRQVYNIAKKHERNPDSLSNEERRVLDEALDREKGTTASLLAHPFNLMTKFAKIISDPDLMDEKSSYITDGEQEAEKLINEWNSQNPMPTERRIHRISPSDIEEFSTKHTVAGKDDEDERTEYTVQIRAFFDDSEKVVAINSVSGALQDRFEKMADGLRINLGATIPPKLKSLIERARDERSHPRGIDDDGKKIPFAKQLIFSDMIGQHNKIRLLLAKEFQIKKEQIAIITGQRNSSPEDIQDIQDGFNANGEDNKYQFVIANEKAEVGINLQKGTQAIHHLTVGWTPDSLQQRNGRGVRQGNKTHQVTIYHYDAKGTFDKIRRQTVDSKADWIGSLLAGGDRGRVEFGGGLSKDQLDVMIEASEEEGGIERVRAAQKEQEAAAREERFRQAKEDTISLAGSVLSELENGDRHAIGSVFEDKINEINRNLALVRIGIAKNQDGEAVAVKKIRSVFDDFFKFLENNIPNKDDRLPYLKRMIESSDTSGILAMATIRLDSATSVITNTEGKGKSAGKLLTKDFLTSVELRYLGEEIRLLAREKIDIGRHQVIAALESLISSSRDDAERAAFQIKRDNIAAAFAANERPRAAFVGGVMLSVGDILHWVSPSGEVRYELVKSFHSTERFTVRSWDNYRNELRDSEINLREDYWRKNVISKDVAYSGTPKHSEIMQKMAEYDDSIVAEYKSKGWHFSATLYSDAWKPINEYRSAKPVENEIIELSNTEWLFSSALTPSRLIVNWKAAPLNKFCRKMIKESEFLYNDCELKFIGSDGDKVKISNTIGWALVERGGARDEVIKLIKSKDFIELASPKVVGMIPLFDSIIMQAVNNRAYDLLPISSIDDEYAHSLIKRLNDLYDAEKVNLAGVMEERLKTAMILSGTGFEDLSGLVTGYSSRAINASINIMLKKDVFKAEWIAEYSGDKEWLGIGDIADLMLKVGNVTLAKKESTTEPQPEPENSAAKPESGAMFLAIYDSPDNKGATFKSMKKIKEAAAAVFESAKKSGAAGLASELFARDIDGKPNRNKDDGCAFLYSAHVSGGVDLEKVWVVMHDVMTAKDAASVIVQKLIKDKTLEAVPLAFDGSNFVAIKG